MDAIPIASVTMGEDGSPVTLMPKNLAMLSIPNSMSAPDNRLLNSMEPTAEIWQLHFKKFDSELHIGRCDHENGRQGRAMHDSRSVHPSGGQDRFRRSTASSENKRGLNHSHAEGQGKRHHNRARHSAQGDCAGQGCCKGEAEKRDEPAPEGDKGV